MERKRKALLALMLYEEMDDSTDLLPLLVRTHSDRSDMYKNRRSEGCFDILVRRHLLDNETKFKRFFRVSRDQFFFLVNLIQNDLKTNPTNRDPRPLTAEMKLAVTLRFLATGESLRSLAFSFRIDHSTISKFLPKVLQSLKFGLEGKVLPSSSEIDWSQKAEQFWNRWDFPNCIGALDGKHVRIISPDNSGSLFFNFKGYFSIVLFALVDADCKFTVIDVGSYGKEGDAGIFSRSNLGKLVEQEEIFPPPRALPSSNEKLPHVIIGDEAFRLDKHVLKPYPQKQAACDPKKKNYNYALCRTRRVTENAFGLLCVVFRVFFTPINLKPETVDTLVFVCCCLHNLLREEFLIHSPSQGPLELPDHEMPSENLIPLAWKGGFSKSEGFKVRHRFTEYFNGDFFKKKKEIMFKSKQK